MKLTFFLDAGRIDVRVTSTTSSDEEADGVRTGDTGGLRLVDTPFTAAGVAGRPLLAGGTGGADTATAVTDLVLGWTAGCGGGGGCGIGRGGCGGGGVLFSAERVGLGILTSAGFLIRSSCSF